MNTGPRGGRARAAFSHWLGPLLEKASASGASHVVERGARLLTSVVAAARGELKAQEKLEVALETQRRTERELADSEARFQEVFRRAPNPLCIARVADGLIYEVNDAFAIKSGYTREEIVNRGPFDKPWWPDTEGERIMGLLRAHGQLKDEEVRVIDGRGEERVILVSANPIVMHGHQCVVWQTVDVTELRRDAETRRALEVRLRQKEALERLGTLAGAIAHDFNNLLLITLGNADLVLHALGPTSPLRGPVQSILVSSQRAAEHTRELLDYAGRGGSKLKPLRLDVLLRQIAELANPLCPPPLSLNLTCSDDAVWVSGDAGQLTRMFVNLIKNSVEALDPQRGQVEIVLTVEADGFALVRVRDNGRGMDEQTRTRMFDPFFSTKLEGSGLGLMSVPAIVERHGGFIEAQSVLQAGTTLALKIPLCPAEDAATAAPAPARTRMAGRVLVVDDEQEVRATVAAMLTHMGFEVVEADGGERALELVAHEPKSVSLAVLDVIMPGLDGLQTLHGLRQLNPELPVLLLSGYSRTDSSRVLAHEVRVSFLAKPCDREALEAAIMALLSEVAAGAAGAVAAAVAPPC